MIMIMIMNLIMNLYSAKSIEEYNDQPNEHKTNENPEE